MRDRLWLEQISSTERERRMLTFDYFAGGLRSIPSIIEWCGAERERMRESYAALMIEALRFWCG